MGPNEPVPQPGITYVTCPDGTRLAMGAWGNGPPAVCSLLHLGDHLEAPRVISRNWYRVLGRHFTCVRYDPRGCGLSDRQVSQLTLDTCVRDLEAVVEALGPQPVVLFGLSLGAPVAVRFAALHPQRVRQLVIYGGYVRGRGSPAAGAGHDRETNAILSAAEVAFGAEGGYQAAFRRALNSRFFPTASSEQLDQVDECTGGRFTGEVVRAYAALGHGIDISDSAARVRCPTLVFHASRDQFLPFAEGSRLASLIPQARFVPVDDDSNAPLEDNPRWPAIEAELAKFFGWPQAPVPIRPLPLTRRQTEVLALVSQGLTDKEIARSLALSPRTVEMHVAHAMKELEAKTRAEAAAKAVQRGLLS